MSATAVSSRARDVWTETGSWEATLTVLRDEGFTKVQSVRATVEILGKPLGEAKALVHESAAWVDRRGQDDEFHASLDVGHDT